MTKFKKNFTPWRSDFKRAIQIALFSVFACYLGGYLVFTQWDQFHTTRTPLTIGAILMLIGVASWRAASRLARRGYYRRNGARVEKNASSDLKVALPESWRMQCGAKSSAGGDIDVILRYKEFSYAVEIKSAKSTWGCNSFFRRLFGFIDARAKYAIAQAKRNAVATSPATKPILWMPLAKQFITNYQGVLIVGGNAKYFSRVLLRL